MGASQKRPYNLRGMGDRPPRLAQIVYRDPVYFVTICTHQRKRLLATPAVQTAFVRFARQGYATKRIAVGRYVIMPDHLHLFVALPEEQRVEQWARLLKQQLGRAIPAAAPVWERGFFDHLLRSDESYAEKWEYVRRNPVRAGLVPTAEEWPFAGEIIAIDRR